MPGIPRPAPPRPALSRLVLAAALGLAVAACGSSSTARHASLAPGLALANCMRSHGVPNFPDPSPTGQIDITPQSGISPFSPAFQAAQNACRAFGKGGGPPPRMSASQRRRAVAFARCMRSHGEPDFPDPILGAPRGLSRVLVLPGMFFAIGPGLDPKSPAFQQAAGACGLPLRAPVH